MKFHTILAIAVLIGAGAWVATGKFSFVGSEAEGAPATEESQLPVTESEPVSQSVAFAVAKNDEYRRRLLISGVTTSDKSTVLAARTAGVIAKLAVEKGQPVAKDDVVMALDGPEKYTAVDAAQSLFEQRQREADADQKLLANGQIGSLRAEASAADLVAARSALEAARAEVDRLEVRVPFAGIVDDVFVETGAWVQPGADVASVIALDPIIAEGEVSEQFLRQVSLGADAHVTFADGTAAAGTLRYISREASNETRTFPLEIAVANPDLRIPAGMSVTIELETSPVPCVLVPRSVITLGPKGEVGVRIIGADGRVAFVSVTIVDDTVKGLVVSGIEDGMKVIVSGQDLVADGQTVTGIDKTAEAQAWAKSN